MDTVTDALPNMNIMKHLSLPVIAILLLLLIQGGLWRDLYCVFTPREDEKDKVDNESSEASSVLRWCSDTPSKLIV